MTIFSRVFYFVVYPSQKILFFNSSKTLCGILMKRCSEALNFCTYILKSNCPTHFHAQITCLRSHSKIADYKLLMKMNPFLLKEPFCSYGSRFGNKLNQKIPMTNKIESWRSLSTQFKFFISENTQVKVKHRWLYQPSSFI